MVCPVLRRWRSALAISLLACFAQAGTESLPGLVKAAPRGLSEAFDVGAATTQHLALPFHATAPVSIPVMLGGESYTLDVAPYSVRSSKFEVLVQVEDGSLIPFDVGAPTTVRGVVRDVPGSIVAGNMSEGRLTATVGLHPDDMLWGIQPRSDVDSTAPASEHIVYSSLDRLASDHSCGNDHATERDDVDHGQTPAASDLGDGGNFVICEIGIDTDVQYYNLNGSSITQTENDIESIINSTDAIYSIDAQIRYEITTIIVRTAEPDPYSSTTSPSSLLNQFDSHWSSSQQGVQRDIAHLFTGRDLDGGVIGIAKLSQICSQNNGYGLSQSRFTSNFTSRVALTAHELGHNWSASHCNSVSDCRIMCSGLGGCTGVVTSFAPVSINSINNEKNSSGCLGPGSPPAPPSISQVSPEANNLFGPSITPIEIIGQNLSFVTSVTVDGVVFSQGQFDVVTNARITLTPPTPTVLGTVNVQLDSPFGASSVASFEWTAPPTILSTSGIAVSTFDHAWNYGGPVADTAFLVISLAPGVVPFQGFDVLAAPIVLNIDTLDDFGLGDYTLNLPGAASGVTFYSQVVTYDTAVTGTSNVSQTLVVF